MDNNYLIKFGCSAKTHGELCGEMRWRCAWEEGEVICGPGASVESDLLRTPVQDCSLFYKRVVHDPEFILI